MKKIFLSLVAMIIATVNFAQSSLVATLSHDGTISTYYGTTALKEALAAADHGDAITLSAGQFIAGDITKAITLRGAGMNVRNDSVNSHETSIVQGTFNINIADSVANRLIVEGLYFTSAITYKSKINNALFMKSRLYSFMSGTGGMLLNSSFIHCRIANRITMSSNSNASLINSVVFNPSNYNTTASNIEFDNCVVVYNMISNNNIIENVINSYYKNCFILNSNSTNLHVYIPLSNVAYYCVGLSNYPSDMFINMKSRNNTNTSIYNDFKSLFKTTKSYDYNDYEMYELSDAAKTKYLGSDGKQVGIYGGNLPYEEDPTTPQITKCNVAAKSTADGKLSVDIEVKAAEY